MNATCLSPHGAVVGLADDVAPLKKFGIVNFARHTHHQNGKIGVLFTNPTEKRLVGRAQRVRSRGIVVIVIHKRAHVQRVDEIGDHQLALGASGETEVDVVHVQMVGDGGVVDVERIAAAAAFGDGGAVIHDRLSVIRGGRFDACVVRHADFNVADALVARQEDGHVLHFGFFLHRAVHGFFVVAFRSDQSRKIRFAAVADQHVGGLAGVNGHTDVHRKGLKCIFHGDFGRIGAQADTRAGAAAGEVGQIGHILECFIGKTLPQFFAVVQRNAVQLQR